MITTFRLHEHRLAVQHVSVQEQLAVDAFWIDLESPNARELAWIRETYDQALPALEDLMEIEATSRFFQDDSGLHVRAYFFHEAAGRLNNVTIAFILNQGRLFTLRTEALVSFDQFRQQIETQRARVTDAYGIMLGLFEQNVDRLADLLEQLHIDLENLSRRVFHAAERDFEEALTLLAGAQDRNDKARLSLMDKQRALSFLLRGRHCSDEQLPLLREILRDIRSLNEHSTFLFEKVQFLMDATTGRINIEQNKIIKIFSIAAVVFLPPTLIASIYGMNFHFLPELSWPFGYPFALILMIAAGIAPYWFFKRRGWL